MHLNTLVEPLSAEGNCAGCDASIEQQVPLNSSRLVLISHMLYFGGVGLVMVVDQLTKFWVANNLPVYQPVDLVEWLAPILSFTSVRNTGVAFGLFQGLGIPFSLLSLVIVVAVVFFRLKVPASEFLLHGALGLVTGGALGNIVDRVMRGYVVDFLDVNFWPLHNWPVFNLADAAIVVGAGLLLLDSFVADWHAGHSDE